MRKLIFFIILIPAIVALGHDIYIFTQAPQKGFHLSDLGALWDKYHKESHDQWKIKLNEISEIVEDISPISNAYQMQGNIQSSEKPKATYLEEFTQTTKKGSESITTQIKEKNYVKAQASNIQIYVGFILEQKAVFIFTSLAAILYILNAIISRIFKEKSSTDKIASIKKQNRKGGGYKYGRK